MTIETALATMTLEQKAGQVMAFGFEGTRLTPELHEMVRKLLPGGLVIFARNVESPPQLARLIDDLQRVAQEEGSPALIVSIDQEGGRIARLRRETGFAEFPSAREVGQSSNPTLMAQQVARSMAAEMKAVGINMDLAPVLDVDNIPANPVIGDRSFGAEPQLVSACGVAFIEALQAEGIMAVGKHFPGHGDTTVDSHVGLPVVRHDRTRLERIEFVPFKAAIAAGVAGIMSSHIHFAAIEPAPNLAGTLSRRVMTDLLRDELKFTGVRLTDSLDMGALQTSGYPVPLAAATALNAGADLLLFNCSRELCFQAHATVVDWVRQGKIESSRLDEAVHRVLQAKARFHLL